MMKTECAAKPRLGIVGATRFGAFPTAASLNGDPRSGRIVQRGPIEPPVVVVQEGEGQIENGRRGVCLAHHVPGLIGKIGGALNP